MILIDPEMRQLQHNIVLYRIFKRIEIMEITVKFDIKYGLFVPEVYYNSKQANLKISTQINDPLFLTLACGRTGIFEAFS